MSELEAQRPLYADQVVEEGGVMTDQMNKFIDQLMRSVGGLSESIETISSSIEALTTRIDDLESLYDDDWHNVGAGGEPAFQNSWVNFGGVYSIASFKKEGNVVFVRGLVRNGSSANTTIFNLPSGYRPQYTMVRSSISAAGYTRLDIFSNGNVTIVSGGSTTWTSIECSFVAS